MEKMDVLWWGYGFPNQFDQADCVGSSIRSRLRLPKSSKVFAPREFLIIAVDRSEIWLKGVIQDLG